MSHERHPDGFRKFQRTTIGKRSAKERIGDYGEIYQPAWSEEQLREQGLRCMDCGVPTCMGGCPIGNIIPEWNDLVSKADWKEALDTLHATNNFPEFTGYTCPAPCEDACVLSYNDDPVTIKDIERAIYDRAWEEGWIKPNPPTQRTGRKVAIVGSGPAGLAAAQQLNRAGHQVTVFERDDEIGGLMIYGIPDFKFAKDKVARRVDLLAQEGIEFQANAEVGTTIPFATLRENFDAVCLAIGAQAHRDVPMPGRHLKGVAFGMEYLTRANRQQAGKPVDDELDARGKRVIVLGGGDTGADCVATAHRQGAVEVIQISIREQPPLLRPDYNPWPQPARTYRKSYAQEEGGAESYSLETMEFRDENGDGHVDCLITERVAWTYDEHGRRKERTVVEQNICLPADLVLVAVGFSGAEMHPFAALGLEMTGYGTIKTDKTMMTSMPGVFAAGDAAMGASLVVWAIGEGRDVARQIDLYLMGKSDLPASLRSHNPPVLP
ncbi:MAG: glutamate synthase subunit beta [Chloroflexaceae bacterium]